MQQGPVKEIMTLAHPPFPAQDRPPPGADTLVPVHHSSPGWPLHRLVPQGLLSHRLQDCVPHARPIKGHANGVCRVTARGHPRRSDSDACPPELVGHASGRPRVGASAAAVGWWGWCAPIATRRWRLHCPQSTAAIARRDSWPGQGQRLCPNVLSRPLVGDPRRAGSHCCPGRPPRSNHVREPVTRRQSCARRIHEDPVSGGHVFGAGYGVKLPAAAAYSNSFADTAHDSRGKAPGPPGPPPEPGPSPCKEGSRHVDWSA